MRILYLTYGTQSGVIKYLCRALSKQGAHITVFNVADNLRYRMIKFKFPSFVPHNLLNLALAFLQYKNDWKQYFKRTEYAFKFMSKEAQKYIEKNHNKFDMVMQSGVLFSASFQQLDIPYCLYLDHTYAISKRYSSLRDLPSSQCTTRKWELLEKKVYEVANCIFTMSQFVKDSLINDYGISQDKIKVIGAGPNFDYFPELSNKQYDGKTILFIGKDFYRKGGKVLLEAFQIVRKKIADARLIIIGDPKEKVPIHQEDVEIKGFINSKDIGQFYQEASLFVLPTLREPFGLVFLEAMSYQLPCIGTEIEAIPEIIKDGRTGFLVPPKNSNVLAEKIIILLNNKNLMMEMGKEGCCKIRENFNWDKVAERMIYEFEKSMESPLKETKFKNQARRAWSSALCLAPFLSLEESLISELAEYKDISKDDVKHRISESKIKLRDEWININGNGVANFYINNDYYLYDLTQFHANYGQCESIISVLEFSKSHKLQKILDFGAGIGSSAILFAREGFSITLADISINLLNYARWRFQKRNLKANFIDLNQESLPDSTFDLIVATDVLEHLDQPYGVLKDIYRALKPGGYFFFNVVETPGEDKPMHITGGITILKEMRGLGFRRLFPNPIPMHGFVKMRHQEISNKFLKYYDIFIFYPIRSLAKRILKYKGKK
ncbi:MAG: glycosyltransferase [Actinomycetota bacterium]